MSASLLIREATVSRRQGARRTGGWRWSGRMEHKGRKEKARIWMRRACRFVRKEKREKRTKEKGGGAVHEDSTA
jgi:hypothetical protein